MGVKEKGNKLSQIHTRLCEAAMALLSSNPRLLTDVLHHQDELGWLAIDMWAIHSIKLNSFHPLYDLVHVFNGLPSLLGPPSTTDSSPFSFLLSPEACKRKEQEPNKDRNNSQKKSRLVFTDLQRRTLFAIFKENKRPSKEMQITISQHLGLELTTVSNFFMNARRRSLEKWQDDLGTGGSSSTSSTCTKA